MLTIYYSPGACSLASHILLEETGVSFETRRVTIANGEHRTGEYLAINPRARVPALDVGGTVITENVAILHYVAGLTDGAGTLPADPLQRARVNELLLFFASSVHVAFAQFWRPERFTSDATLHPAIVEGGRVALADRFREIESLIEGREWLVGERFTPADLYLFVFWRWGIRIGMPMDAFPSWRGHMLSLLERPAVMRVLAREGLDPSEFLPREEAA